MAANRQKFATQANPELLAKIKAIAEKEGRQFQAVVEEAFQDYIDRKSGIKPRQEVLQHFNKSLVDFDILYEKLAK